MGTDWKDRAIRWICFLVLKHPLLPTDTNSYFFSPLALLPGIIYIYISLSLSKSQVPIWSVSDKGFYFWPLTVVDKSAWTLQFNFDLSNELSFPKINIQKSLWANVSLIIKCYMWKHPRSHSSGKKKKSHSSLSKKYMGMPVKIH